MNSAVEELTMRVSLPPQANRDMVRTHIEAIDAIDSRFSSVALRMFKEPRMNSSVGYLIAAMRQWFGQPSSFEAAFKVADHYKGRFGADYNAALLILDGAALAHAIGTMDLPKDYSVTRLIRDASDGDYHLAPLKLIPRPNMLEANYNEVHGYYRPLAVAAAVLNADGETERFLDQAPHFMRWVAAQPNINGSLAVALKLNTLDPDTIGAITGMQKTTPVALHGGLI